MATATHGSLAENAAAYLRRSGHTDEGSSGDSQEIDRQAARLIQWAQEKNVILPDSYTSGFEKFEATTAEHEVFYRPSDNRAVKLTHAGSFGATPAPKGEQQAATPLFYLCRLGLMNEFFLSDLRLEGVILAKSLILFAQGTQPRLVVSQPWIQADNLKYPYPTNEEITAFMKSCGFTLIKKSYFGWQNKKAQLLILDARADNFIKSKAGVVPIDLVISKKQTKTKKRKVI